VTSLHCQLGWQSARVAGPHLVRSNRCGRTRSTSTLKSVGALGGTRTPNLLIRRELRANPLPGHTAVDLLKCCSALRNRRQR